MVNAAKWEALLSATRAEMTAEPFNASAFARPRLSSPQDLPQFTPHLNALFSELDKIVATHSHPRLRDAPIPDFKQSWYEIIRQLEGNNRSSMTTATVMRLGSIAAHRPQVDMYYRMAASPFVRTICEVGFNAGHSTAVWLSASGPEMPSG